MAIAIIVSILFALLGSLTAIPARAGFEIVDDDAAQLAALGVNT